MLVLTDPISKIERLIRVEIAKQLNVAIPKILQNVSKDIRLALIDSLKQSGTYRELTAGNLAYAFGMTHQEAESTLDKIIDMLLSSLILKHVKVRASGSGFDGGIEIHAIKSTFTEVLSSQLGTVYLKNGALPWLEWLLTEGDTIVIVGYDVAYGNFPNSRSGNAIMIKSATGFRVPPAHSGTIDDNWITRAILQSIKHILDIAEKSIKDNLIKVL